MSETTPTSCTHDWKIQPDASDRRVTRYQCATCQRWGYRMWTAKENGRIQLYTSPTPVASWYKLPESPPRPAKKRINPEEVVETFVPDFERWRNPS